MFSSYPGREDRPGQYRAAGIILGETAQGIGLDVPEDEQQRWGYMMGRLATADDTFEGDRDYYEPGSLLEHLGLDPDEPELQRYAADLLDAMEGVLAADQIGEHYDFRRGEAVACVDLLSHEARDRNDDTNTWSQIYRVSLAGQYLDSIRDAHEDVAEHGNFSVAQLQVHGLKRFVSTAVKVYPRTWRQLTRASHRHGLDRYLVGTMRDSLSPVTTELN